jgi:hypothetical protein
VGWVTGGFVLLAVYLWGAFGWESLTCWLAAPRTGVRTADTGTQD